jgi:hypothetical protein
VRIVALSLALLSISICVSAEELGEMPSDVGKSPDWVAPAATAQATPTQIKPPDPPSKKSVERGQPYQQALVPPDYGEAAETPNHRRQRLGLKPNPTPPDPEYGIFEETPNQQKKRVALVRPQ